MVSDEILLSLLKKAREGDNESFRNLVEETRDKIFGAVVAMTGREVIAEEILQEGYIALWDINISGDVEKPSKWLYKFCVNRSIDYLRKKETLFLEDFEEATESFVSDFTPPDIIVENNEMREKLLNILQKLPDKERITLLLSDYLGMDCFEISSLIGTAPSTVRNQISKGRKKVLSFLKENKK